MVSGVVPRAAGACSRRELQGFVWAPATCAALHEEDEELALATQRQKKTEHGRTRRIMASGWKANRAAAAQRKGRRLFFSFQ